jgi:hypothetical protein
VSVEFVNTGPCCSCTLLSLFATKCFSTSHQIDWHVKQADRKRKSKPIMFRAGICSRLSKYVPMRQNLSKTIESKRSTGNIVFILPIVKGLMSRDGCFLKDYKGSTFVRMLMV